MVFQFISFLFLISNLLTKQSSQLVLNFIWGDKTHHKSLSHKHLTLFGNTYFHFRIDNIQKSSFIIFIIFHVFNIKKIVVWDNSWQHFVLFFKVNDTKHAVTKIVFNSLFLIIGFYVRDKWQIGMSYIVMYTWFYHFFDHKQVSILKYWTLHL